MERGGRPPGQPVECPWSNYVIHKSKKTQKALANYGDRFVLHFLPPYCPNDNKIERLWKDLHDTVTRNHRCTTIDDLLENVAAWLPAPRRAGRGRSSGRVTR